MLVHDAIKTGTFSDKKLWSHLLPEYYRCTLYSIILQVTLDGFKTW